MCASFVVRQYIGQPAPAGSGIALRLAETSIRAAAIRKTCSFTGISLWELISYLRIFIIFGLMTNATRYIMHFSGNKTAVRKLKVL